MASSTIYICSDVGLTNDYKHTLYFNSESDQRAYFTAKVIKDFSGYTYLRKNWEIKLESDFESATYWQYLYFQNGDTGKYWYYFITDVQYISDNTVKLYVEMDVLQSYHFDYGLLPCFVEREHSATDNIGDNVVEENIDVGPLTVRGETAPDMSELCILMMSTFNPNDMSAYLGGSYDGIFSGLTIYAVELSQAWMLCQRLRDIDSAGKSDGIVSMWMYPKSMVLLDETDGWEQENLFHIVKGVDKNNFTTCIRPTQVGTVYSPRNKKLLTYPFNFLYVTNNSGGGAVFKYELFGDPTHCQFKIVGTTSPEATCKIYPLNYNNSQHNYDEGLIMSGFPTCAWNQDAYKLWLAQNQNTQTVSTTMSALTIAGGIIGAGVSLYTGNVGGAIASIGGVVGGAGSIANQQAQKKDRQIQPPQAQGGYSASVNVVAGFQTFTIQRKCVNDDYAEMLDMYFDRFGYQTNAIKTPNRKSRTHWTFTKTQGCKISGNIPVADKVKIQAIYDSGVTFWNPSDQIGNYDFTKSNSPTGKEGA